VAQEFSHILLNLNIDWEEKLSLYTGDIVANHIFKSLTKAKNTLSTQRNKVIEMIKNGAIEEKKIAAPIIAVTHFCDQVSDLRSDFARLDKRLARLEAKQ
jgi:ubiquinone biosynthesis protein UbiJ